MDLSTQHLVMFTFEMFERRYKTTHNSYFTDLPKHSLGHKYNFYWPCNDLIASSWHHWFIYGLL